MDINLNMNKITKKCLTCNSEYSYKDYKSRIRCPDRYKLGYCSSECYKKSDIFKSRQDSGQLSRLKKMSESGYFKFSPDSLKYTETCVVCNIEYSYTNSANYPAFIKHGCCSSSCYKNSDIFKEIQKKAQEKRKNVLIEKGKYSTMSLDIGTTKKCLNCNNDYTYSRENASLKNGFCCRDCYTESGIPELKRRKSCLTNAGINISCKSDKEINDLFHEYSIKHAKKGQTKRVKAINNNHGFEELGKKGSVTRKRRFLIQHNILTEQQINNSSKEEIEKLFLENYNKITKVGEKIKNGMISKNGSIENHFKIVHNTTVNNRIKEYCKNENIDFENSSKEEKEFIIKLANTEFVNKTFLSISRIEWKRKCLISFNEILDIDNFSDKEIEQKYSLYIGKRTNFCNCKVANNGYRNTKKGWYKFLNLNLSLFYRSSWEERIMMVIDNLIRQEKLISVKEPSFIKYYDSTEERERIYYPDLEYSYFDSKLGKEKTIIVEIKPSSKLTNQLNLDKFKSAIELYGESFVVLTEKEIFCDMIEEILTSL